MSVRAAVRAVLSTGLLWPSPLRAVVLGGRVAARYGASLYSLTVWTASRCPDAPALIEASGVTTFRGLVERADLIADTLATRVPPGGTLGLLGRNHSAFVATLLAGLRLGVRVLLLNTFHAPEQVARVAREHQLDLLVADEEFLAGVQGADPTLPICSAATLEALQRPSAPAHVRARRGGRLVVLTSGSTGQPKVVDRRVRPGEALRTLTALLTRLDVRAGAPTLLTLPLFHGHGLMTLALSLTFGAPLHLFRRGTAELYERALLTQGIEVLVVAPTVLHRLLERPAMGRAPTLRTIVCGSAPLSVDLATRTLRRFGPVLFNLYGASEAGLIALATPTQLLAAPDSVGELLPGAPVVLRREDGGRAAPGEVGEVVVGGVRTGDVGHLSASGWLTLRGRRDDLIICGGENVYPEEVEGRIAQLPYVRACAVLGVPSEEYGQRLAALMVHEDTHPPVPDTVVEADLRALLPRTLRPACWQFVPALPRTALGKLVRAQLRPPENAR
ncbi:AMP-binding protein [Deinococcus maricopensis]|uniref:O-succinylbenzoate--CoA ligase n=1 Tax=Deinococcus maricopensis (strain DSM 21211 / LMG 22137 / NRRL B-23946 / LB-34) TaxID=709986 RepID=E8U4V4_DEIML|nr:AMP-binding protein [Deinococcus maricopensis]ADV66093.1 o-succinylbenzoate--CoA ligase [Deinococcus maricopensis DSM 21211]